MSFNHEKWERIQRQRHAGNEQYRHLSEEWQNTKAQAGKFEALFLEAFDPRQTAGPVIAADRKLSEADLAKRLAALADGSLSLKEFGLKDDSARSRLIQVYDYHLAAKKAYERREAQSEVNKGLGASFERLQEFARHHAKVNDSTDHPVQDRQIDYPSQFDQAETQHA